MNYQFASNTMMSAAVCEGETRKEIDSQTLKLAVGV